MIFFKIVPLIMEFTPYGQPPSTHPVSQPQAGRLQPLRLTIIGNFGDSDLRKNEFILEDSDFFRGGRFPPGDAPTSATVGRMGVWQGVAIDYVKYH
jgi:hypothetical protein